MCSESTKRGRVNRKVNSTLSACSVPRGKAQQKKQADAQKKKLSQKEKDYCSSSAGRGRPKKSKKSIQAEAYLAKGYQLCSVAGCIKRVQQGGVCCRHGAKTTRALCSYKGTDEGFNGFSKGVGAGGQCPNVAKRGGLCRRHGAFDLPDCSDPFCKRVAQKGDDYCVLHTRSIWLPQKEGNRKRTVVYDGTERQKKKPKLKPFDPLDTDNDNAGETLKKNNIIRPQGLSEQAKTNINKWIEEHSLHPFPTREEKDAWIKLYGIEKDYLLDGYLHRARKKIKENSKCKQDNDVSSLKTATVVTNGIS